MNIKKLDKISAGGSWRYAGHQ